MHLTDQEKKMLDGSYGEPVKKAMQIMVALGEGYGAEKMLKVKNVHMPGASIVVAGEAGTAFVEEMEAKGGSFVAMTTTNPSCIDPERWREMDIKEKDYEIQSRLTEAYAKMGALTCGTCTPYFIGNIPRRGEHLSWGESSAVAFSNSVLGARTNREGGPTALAAALTGRVPAYGLHLDENRAGEALFKVTAKLKDITDYGSLGYYVGKKIDNGIPVFEGIPQSATWDELKMLGASLASSGAVALFHVVGVTPEAPSLDEAFQGKKDYPVIEVDDDALEEAVELLNKEKSKDVHWVVLGCPHLSINEIQEIVSRIEGKKVHPDVTLWLLTSRPVKAYAERMGYDKVLYEAGGSFICETCPVLSTTDSTAEAKGFTSLATNSAKLAHYAPGQFGIMSFYGDLGRCIEAAVTSKWR